MATQRMKSNQIRQEWREVLDYVRQGGHIVVEHYNRPVAMVVPYDAALDDTPARRPSRPAAPAPDVAMAGPDVDQADQADEAEPERREERKWAEEAEREQRQFQARLKPVPEFGEGYQMAEWPGTGRYYLVYEGERIGHAVKTTFGTQWEAHTGTGAMVPGSGTYKTRRDALIQVALHHQQTTHKRPKKRH